MFLCLGFLWLSCCRLLGRCCVLFFFFNDTATTEIYTLSLHDALPISRRFTQLLKLCLIMAGQQGKRLRSEEHTSDLQSHHDLVCRLLLEKKKPMRYIKKEQKKRKKPTQNTWGNIKE